jgi:membrane-bound lytic murein transglycosylase MltF
MIKKPYFLLLTLVLVACNESAISNSPELAVASETAPPTQTASEANSATSEESVESQPRLSLEQIQQELDIPVVSEAWAGDFNDMVDRRVIRVLTVYGLGRYFVDNGQEKGITYELLKMFEDTLNKNLGRKHVRIHIVFIPVARDELITGLLEGRGDIAAAGLTITPERDEVIDFSNPLSRELSEILVTGPSAPAVDTIDDLAGKEMYVRASSSYRSSLDALNQRFREEGKKEIVIRDVSEFLEDEDILEMVNSGALEWAVVDDYKSEVRAGV